MSILEKLLTFVSTNSIIKIKHIKDKANVIIDGACVATLEPGIHYNITINGDVNSLDSVGRVEVNGNVGSIDTTGAVTVQGSVNGDIDTTGSVTVGGSVGGSIDTVGKVTVKNKEGQ